MELNTETLPPGRTIARIEIDNSNNVQMSNLNGQHGNGHR
jgi:hypothetical protein